MDRAYGTHWIIGGVLYHGLKPVATKLIGSTALPTLLKNETPGI